MKFYRYPFSHKQIGYSSIYIKHPDYANLHNPYTTRAKILFLLWKSIPLFRKMYTVSNEIKDKFFQSLGKYSFYTNNIISFTSNDQHTKFIFLDADSNKNIKSIGKTGSDNETRELVLNELEAISNPLLKDYAPKTLYKYQDEDGIIMITEFIEYSVKGISESLKWKITNALIDIGSKSLKKDTVFNLYYCLGHGDLCPWNIRSDRHGKTTFIDWEFCGEYPLGYDLFSFFIQFALLTSGDSGVGAIQKNRKFIDAYFNAFNVINWKPYLQLYLHSKINSPKIEKELQKKHYRLAGIILDKIYMTNR